MSASLPSISIAQFAGIRAALAEGFELEEVLAQEGVPSWRWPELETEMTLAVVDDEDTRSSFAAHLAEAEDHLSRPVVPLDDDLEAWAGFVGALAERPQLPEELGLRPTDLGRLQRRWGKRFSEEPSLAKKAAELKDEAPAPPDAVAAGEVELTPFSWSPAADEAAARHGLEPIAFLAETAPAKKGAVEEALPFAGTRPAPPGTLAIEPVAELGQTAPMSSRSGRKAATPFEPDPVEVAEVGEASPEVKPIVAPRAAKPLVLPRDPKRVAPPAAGSLEPLEPLEPLEAVEALEPEAELAGTRSAVPVPPGPALPFQGKRDAPGPIADRLEPVAAMGGTAPLEPVAAMGGTAPVEPEDGGTAMAHAKTVMAEAVPPPRGQTGTVLMERRDPLAERVVMDPKTLAASPINWSPEDYGRFRAALEAPGADRAAVMKAFHVRSERMLARLDEVWQQRMADAGVAARVKAGRGRG